MLTRLFVPCALAVLAMNCQQTNAQSCDRQSPFGKSLFIDFDAQSPAFIVGNLVAEDLNGDGAQDLVVGLRNNSTGAGG